MSKSTTTRRFYAIQWTYGRASDSDGKRCGSYYAFPTVADRQAWIDDASTAYTSQGGFREAIISTDSELRSVIRHDAQPYLSTAERKIVEGGEYQANKLDWNNRDRSNEL